MLGLSLRILTSLHFIETIGGRNCMLHVFSRTEGLSGTEKRKGPDQLKVAVFGIGTVGSYAVEALARAGVGTLILVDYGEVSAKKLDRQIVALRSTIGKKKVQVEKARVMDINENAIVHTYETFFGEDTIDLFDFSSYDYVVDAMDHVPAKLLLLKQVRKSHTPMITCMGIGNAWNPSCFQIADFSKTVNLPFVRKIRQELNIQKTKNIKVFYSTQEFSKKKRSVLKEEQTGVQMNGISFSSGIAGFMIAAQVVSDLTE